MSLRTSLVLLCAVVCARAAQPEAAEPVEAELRPLPWGQLNFLHSTDTHGWLAGHLREYQYGADWGDYISFAQRLRERADSDGTDLLLVDTGDRVDGNGLYDASDPKGKYTRDIFRNQEIDIITTGNHELYRAETSYYEYYEQVKNFKGNYLASNLDYIKDDGSQVPMAQRYKKFTTKNQGIRIMAFGFIFDFHMNSNRTVVQDVRETVKETWFKDAIKDPDVDLFIVAGHVALFQTEYAVIFEAIRKQRWDTPIQFFAGHAHVRGYRKYDDKAHAIASGRYMETIGFQSISGLSTGGNKGGKGNDSTTTTTSTAKLSFGRRYIDNNLYSYHQHTGLNASTFPTEAGASTSAQITSARHSMGLDKKFGCVPRTLWLNRAPYPHKDSIFSWLGVRVFPEAVVAPGREDTPRIILGNTGAMRFDLFVGAFTRDTTYMLSPFPGGFRYIADVPYKYADRLAEYLNHQDKIFAANAAGSLDALQAKAPQRPVGSRELNVKMQLKRYDGQQVPLADGAQAAFRGNGGKDDDDEPKLTPGYTTKDDLGDDGDDTVHAPIDFYRVPNVFESRVGTLTNDSNGNEVPVSKVDIVYLEFVQPFVLESLKFFGGEYNESDTKEYISRDLNAIITDWVTDNWAGDC